MAEKRKPTFVMLLKKEGKKKTNKVEFFPRELFTDEPMLGKRKSPQFRLRVNGKWWPKDRKAYYAGWELRDIVWSSIELK